MSPPLQQSRVSINQQKEVKFLPQAKTLILVELINKPRQPKQKVGAASKLSSSEKTEQKAKVKESSPTKAATKNDDSDDF
mmetsp:Transcript_2109/g.2684  ORF Transcript_2109/g.2684 Transcript_2109/m.2684 type:complete len:80 (+) Transcript_2109:391-630(+)